MKEDLLQYMSQRTQKGRTPVTTGGPLVTISREKGCPGNTIAGKLARKLTIEHNPRWRFVNKEIIEKSAKELHVNPSKINHVIYSEDKGFFRDLIHSFGEKYYESDVAIKRNLAELITQSASKGNVILVGIGGVAITKNFANSLHIKLTAPYKHRLKIVAEKENLSMERAREYMDETDVNRKMLIDYFNGIRAGDDLFHAQFNCALLTEDEIVDGIAALMKARNLI